MTLFYRAHVFCCTNRRPAGHPAGSCADKNGERLRNYMKAKAKELGLSDVKVNGTDCLGRCGHGPCLVIYPEGIWYAPHTEADIDEILTAHLQRGERVERLLLPEKAASAG